MSTDEQLRREVDLLGRMFGDVVRRFEGEEAFNLIEEVRRLARQFTSGDMTAADQLSSLFQQLSLAQLRIVVRAFSTFLELSNLAEDRQRVRTLRKRERDFYPAPVRDSIPGTIKALKQRELSATEMQELLRRIHVALVFTAHPTEAKRRSLRSKVRAIRRLMNELDSDRLLPSEVALIETQLRGELIKLWQTDLIRPYRPTVSLEVQRGLSFQPVLWATVPRVMQSLREATSTRYPEARIEIPKVLEFGSWMGGDRDGHPFVTPEITTQTCQWLRTAALEAHLEVRDALADSLSISQLQSPACSKLEARVQAAIGQWPALATAVEGHGPRETFRRWLRVIRWRLEQTGAAQLAAPPPVGSYQNADELAADVEAIRQTLIEDGSIEVAVSEVQSWLDQITVFGFHTARLDIRQHADFHREAIDEVLAAAGLAEHPEALPEPERQQVLATAIAEASSRQPTNPGPKLAETLELFQTIRRIGRTFGMEALGGHIVSMTREPSDLLTVLWFWKWSEQTDGGHQADASLHLPIIPLFETISDLERAPEILSTLLDTTIYREMLRDQGDRQIVMIGYSDSTKDGGYLAACWNLQRSQSVLHDVAAARGVKLTFFHGRGGSLGRGGGPAARAILSLPTPAFDGSLRLTEQGEILAERYDDSQIAFRHLEQVVSSVLTATTQTAEAIPHEWQEKLDELASLSFRHYRRMLDHPSFRHFFRNATPITDIETLRIASRPARRVASDRIEDLRAIPWVFAWTQCRCLIPAWFGLGTALGAYLESSSDAIDNVRYVYRHWPFFRATIDNAVLAVAKSNLPVFRRYAELAGDDVGSREIMAMIEDEWARTDEVLRNITCCGELLDDVPWLKRSITVRNGYVDPLNLIQIELQLRGRNDQLDEAQANALAHLKQLVVKGVAAGMRTTG